MKKKRKLSGARVSVRGLTLPAGNWRKLSKGDTLNCLEQGTPPCKQGFQ
jgi:hypothetical protein